MRYVLCLIGVWGVVVLGVAACGSDESEGLKVGLITKTADNPFFVAMREGAREAAAEWDGELLLAAGGSDVDHAAQAAAIADMVADGAQTILISPSDSAAIVPDIQAARQAGVMVIALDSPTEPQEAADALFATDNFQAGVAIGRYAQVATEGKRVKIAALHLETGIAISGLRYGGFLEGFGIAENDSQIVCERNAQGDRELARRAMADCLDTDPDIDLVYTFSEQTAFGAWEALKEAGREREALIVSIDGSCAGVRAVAEGRLAATSQQSPRRMAALGVAAAARFADTGEKASGYTDTGFTLITARPQAGVSSEDTQFGLANCY